MNKKQIVGIVIFILLILIIVGIKVFGNTNSNNPGIIPKNLTTVYVATGGGKEDFISDEDIITGLMVKQ